MNLLSLGTAGRRLFAVHDPAINDGMRSRAAVICNPLGAEYVHAHRTLRHLATRLTRRGLHVLRFDYFGTGDSEGDDSDASLAGMQGDVQYAIEAAQDIAGVEQVTLIGLRAGATVAAYAALQRPTDVESLVLWDPVDAPPVPANPAPRSLVIRTTDPIAGATAFADADADALLVPAPCCWENSITTSGALPVAVFQRIETWLR